MDFDNHEKYTTGEEIANAVTHGIGFGLSVAALVLLVVIGQKYNSAQYITSVSLYGSTLIILYLISTLYHSMPKGKAKNVFEILDHSSIYLLIAGTYTPFTIVSLNGTLGWSYFGVIWGMAIIGICFKVFFTKKFLIFSTSIYVVMGWLIIFAIQPLFASLAPAGAVFLTAGGILYTIGAVFYVWRKIKFHHAVWHLFVLAGSVFHFFTILLFMYR